MTTCREALLRLGAEAVASSPELSVEWRNSPGVTYLRIRAPNSTGFDVSLAGHETDIELTAGGFHSHFDDNPDPEELVRYALGFVRDLLSPAMRLRELVAGDTPYRWILESKREGEWFAEEETGLLFWPFWSNRSERIFQNHVLPSRESVGDPLPEPGAT